MVETYVDQLEEQRSVSLVWKAVSLVTLVILAIQSVSTVYLSTRLVSNIDRVRYVLAPGIQTFTTVRPGELPQSYVEEAFRFITDRLNGWSYASVKDSYQSLFDHFYSHDLTERTKANLMSLNYFKDIETRKLVSFWNIQKEESEFHWCGKVAARGDLKGVACGIVTGEQQLFAEHSIPVSRRKVSYLIYAINVAPTPKNLFALEIMRVKRGPLKTLRRELENSLANGVLPEEDSNENTY